MGSQFNPTRLQKVVEKRRKQAELKDSGGGDSPLDRYLRIVELVANFPHGVSLTQIMEILALPKTTVHRLLRGLVASGVLISQSPRYGPYVLGNRLLNILYAGMPDNWVEWLARPILQELADKTGESCFMACLSDFSIHSVALATPENDVRSYVLPGRILTPHGASSAKAILAFQTEATVRAILPSPLPAITDRTKTRLKDILAEYAEIRESQIALCIGEDVPGYAGIASPIILPDFGVRYSVAITGTIDDLISKNQKKYSDLLRRFADRLARAMLIKLAQAQDLAP